MLISLAAAVGAAKRDDFPFNFHIFATSASLGNWATNFGVQNLFKLVSWKESMICSLFVSLSLSLLLSLSFSFSLYLFLLTKPQCLKNFVFWQSRRAFILTSLVSGGMEKKRKLISRGYQRRQKQFATRPCFCCVSPDWVGRGGGG